MALHDDIRQYYFDHFSELPPEKQFHFLSRLAAWHQDKDAEAALETVRPEIVLEPKQLHNFLKELITHPPDSPINAAEKRKPYFDKYPNLRGQMMALFRVRHMYFIYGADKRDELLDIVSLKELQELVTALINDADAVAALSTYAINFIYLVSRILYPEDNMRLDPQKFYELKDLYNTKKPDDIQLLIYLYTHCIIGESNFYMRHVNGDVYTKMLQAVEQLIEQNFEMTHLDIKLEFLVCAKICKFNTKLNERILDECIKSVSPQGTFLVDTVNKFPQQDKTTFELSEHRNVLFIMSQTPFTPKISD